jgi:hypothetical protein
MRGFATPEAAKPHTQKPPAVDSKAFRRDTLNGNRIVRAISGTVDSGSLSNTASSSSVIMADDANARAGPYPRVDSNCSGGLRRGDSTVTTWKPPIGATARRSRSQSPRSESKVIEYFQARIRTG